MMIDVNEVLARTNELYSQRKGQPVAIQMDSLKSAIQALVEAINKELLNPIVVHTTDGEEA